MLLFVEFALCFDFIPHVILLKNILSREREKVKEKGSPVVPPAPSSSLQNGPTLVKDYIVWMCLLVVEVGTN